MHRRITWPAWLQRMGRAGPSSGAADACALARSWQPGPRVCAAYLLPAWGRQQSIVSPRSHPLSSWKWIRTTCRSFSRSSGRAGPMPSILGRPPRGMDGPWVPRHRGQPAGLPCCRGMRRGGRGHKKRCPTGLAVQGPMHLACWRAPRLPGRPTLRRTLCCRAARGLLGPPVSAHVMRGEHTLLRASSLLPGLASGLGGLPPVRRAPAAVEALPRVGRRGALAPPVCSAVAVGILASATPPGGCLSVRPGPTLMAGLTAPRCAPALAPASVGSHCAPALRALSYAGVCSPSLRLPPARPAAALRHAVTAGSAAAFLCMVRAALLSALVRPLPLPAALEGLL